MRFENRIENRARRHLIAKVQLVTGERNAGFFIQDHVQVSAADLRKIVCPNRQTAPAFALAEPHFLHSQRDRCATLIKVQSNAVSRKKLERHIVPLVFWYAQIVTAQQLVQMLHEFLDRELLAIDLGTIEDIVEGRSMNLGTEQTVGQGLGTSGVGGHLVGSGQPIANDHVLVCGLHLEWFRLEFH